MDKRTGMLHGVVVMLATPMHEDGSVDVASLRRLVAHQAGAGAHGLAIMGLAGEGTLLTAAERRLVIETVLDASPLPVLVGITAARSADAIALGKLASGAAELMMSPASDEPSQRDHYMRVADAVGVPLMVQDAPGYTGASLGLDLVFELCAVHENIRSFKGEAVPVWPILSAAAPVLPTFGGQAGLYLMDVLDAGCAGVIPGAESTARLVAIWEAYQAGRREDAYALFRERLPFIVELAQTLELMVTGTKHLLWREGVIASPKARIAEPDPAVLARLESLDR